MSGQLGNVIFIIWRECVEALLVIGILNAWLTQQDEDRALQIGRRYLWSGVGAGIALSLLFAFVLVRLGDSLSDVAQQIYQASTVLIAAALIVQMVFWMRKHGRTLKRELETKLSDAAEDHKWWSVFVLSLIAVAREGTETVVFIYGSISASQSDNQLQTYGAIALGLGLSCATYFVLQMGNRFLSWRVFFKITEAMLLLLAGSLIVTGVEHLVELDVLPALSARLWDTSAILPDHGIAGGLVASLTGYRAKPYLITLLVFGVYWAAMWFSLRPKAPARS